MLLENGFLDGQISDDFTQPGVFQLDLFEAFCLTDFNAVPF